LQHRVFGPSRWMHGPTPKCWRCSRGETSKCNISFRDTKWELTPVHRTIDTKPRQHVSIKSIWKSMLTRSQAWDYTKGERHPEGNDTLIVNQMKPPKHKRTMQEEVLNFETKMLFHLSWSIIVPPQLLFSRLIVFDLDRKTTP
jgi:hypothetical protein